MDQATPEAIALTAQRYQCRSVAFTYNDPIIFAEYAMDIADACHALDIQTVAVTAGYVHAKARRDFFNKMDAANVDLKAFDDQFYYKLTGSRLQPVLDTLLYIKHQTEVWLEITTLLIPGKNDSDKELKALSSWVYKELGADVPLHFSAFHPEHRMRDIPPTPASTLIRARDIALDVGLQFVYTGNVHYTPGDTTFCPQCQTSLIERDWYEINRYQLTESGRCPNCGAGIAGRFGDTAGAFGRKRLPVIIQSSHGETRQ